LVVQALARNEDQKSAMTDQNTSTLPDVDIFVLSWNRPGTTLEAIDSALAQQGVNAHIYVFDQGSEEQHLHALRERAAAGEFTLIENGTNIGPAAGRNRATEAGSSPYVFGLDNDAEYADEQMVLRAVKRFEQEPELGLMAFRIVNYWSNEDDPTISTYPKELQQRLREEFYTSRFVAAGYAIRRAAYEKTGGYDESIFMHCEERDLAFQVINAGYKVLYNPEVVIRHKEAKDGRFVASGNRFYLLARNATYLDYKYFRNRSRAFFLFWGYIARGIANRVPLQGIRGAFDSLKLMRRLKPNEERLSEDALAYVWEHDGRYRGGIMQRAQRDILRNKA
jgi:GT2 family glycosyltransferase